MIEKHDITAVILAGGVGSRLRSVTDLPKPVVPVLGRPYLFYVLEALKYQGLRRVVISAGYRSEVLIAEVGKWNPGLEIAYVVEEQPMGTGGALRFAANRIATPYALVLNGDSFCDFPLDSFIDFHATHPEQVSLLATEVEDGGRYGRVVFDDGGQVRSFEEKGTAGPGWINAGIYLLPTSRLAGIPETVPCSLEKEVFPLWLREGFHAHPVAAPFLDIGTPESYTQKEAFLTGVRERRQARAREGMFPGNLGSPATRIKTGVGVFILNERDEVLLEKRSDCGLWGLPGGSIQPGESIIDTARREVREETGLELGELSLFGIYSEPGDRTLRYPDNGDLRQLIDIVVMARALPGEISLSPESDDMQYFSIDRIPASEMIIPPAREPLLHLKEKKSSILH